MDEFKARREMLRRRMKAARAALTFEEIELAGTALLLQVLSLPEIHGQRTIGSYVSSGSEIPTIALNTELKRRGHNVVLPVCSISEKGRMEFYGFAPRSSFVVNHFHILEPPADPRFHTPPERIEILLLPLTAFDARGSRLGMGGGYYDRMLKRVSPGCRLIGLAYDFQQAEEIPTENWDMPLHEVITPTRHLRFI